MINVIWGGNIMALNQAYQAYKNNKILTATPAELTLLLYEGAIKFCNIAIMGVEQGDLMKTYNSVKRVEDIIVELRATLDFKYPVAKDFDNVYKYIYDLLVEGNIKKDKEILAEALEELRGMRDTWKQVMEKNRASN